MKRTAAITALAAAGLVVTAGAPAAPQTAALQIDHVVRGCHTWSLNGGPNRPAQQLRLARGGSLVVTNDDLMAQDLVKTGGPAVRMQLVRQSHMGAMHMAMQMEGKPTRYAMAHMGAKLRVTFPGAGTYRFELVDRGDYFDGIRTVGPDNELTLTVTVA